MIPHNGNAVIHYFRETLIRLNFFNGDFMKNNFADYKFYHQSKMYWGKEICERKFDAYNNRG